MTRIIVFAVSFLIYSTPSESMPFVGSEFNRTQNDFNLNDSTRNSEVGQLRTFKLKLRNSNDQVVVISMVNSGITIVGYDGDELKIETKNYVPPSAQKEGLKPIYNKTQDNTNLGLSVIKVKNQVAITQASLIHYDYLIYVPRNVSLSYEEVGNMGEDLNISDVNGELEVKMAQGNATLVNVMGPVVANSTKSNLTVKFSKFLANKPSSIISIKGFVDITLPGETKASVKLRSVQGEIFTDFTIAIESSSGIPTITGGHTINGMINGGGAELTVHTVNSDIFIRKSK